MTQDKVDKSPRILVVDDDWLNQELIEGVLSTIGYTTLKAPSAEKALLLAQQEQPDLVVLDARLPRISGYEVCTMLKSNQATAHIPIVMITGHKTKNDDERARQAGADVFLERLATTDQLLDHINALLK